MSTNMAQKPIKPYLIEAVLNYCRDNACTPYVMVAVDTACQVPMEYVRDNRIVFDVSDEAVHNLAISDDWFVFQARFGEKNEIFTVEVPLNRIVAVMPLEYQELGLQFEVTETPKRLTDTQETESTAQEKTAPRRPMRVK